MGDGHVLGQGGDGGSRVKWLNSGYILNEKLTRFPDGLNIMENKESES